MGDLEPTEFLLEGRRYLEWLTEDCTILEDYSFQKNEKWLLKIRLRNNGVQSQFVPIFSDWHVFIDTNYPKGNIEFFPSKKKGIPYVFPHQSPHPINREEKDYYFSNLCLEQFSPDLKFDSNSTTLKLYNYVKKALEWVKQAANGNLLEKGDYFETVAYPTKFFDKKVLFSENESTFNDWLSHENKVVGFFNMKRGEPNTEYKNFLYITDYYKAVSGYMNNNDKIVSYSWGNYVLNEKSSSEKGIWIKLLKMPYTEPWEAPNNWPQLIKIFKENNINFRDDIQPFLNNLRDGRQHIMILGFPISKKVDDTPTEICWQSLELPILSDYYTPDRFIEGFRKEMLGFEMADMRRYFLKEKLPLEWINTENWSPYNIVSRGNTPKVINQIKFLFVGVGALGSILSEMIVRSGVENLDIIDSDIIEIGNLTRHTLIATDIGKFKATSIEKKLTNSFIHYKGRGYNLSIEEFIKQKHDALEKYDVIVETTGSDEVLETIANENLKCILISTSIGIHAKRMYINIKKGNNYDIEEFKEGIKDAVFKDREDFPDFEYPRDGLGCWHPLFPARIDHISLLASSAVSIIEGDIALEQESMTIIERGNLGTLSILKRKEYTNEN